MKLQIPLHSKSHSLMTRTLPLFLLAVSLSFSADASVKNFIKVCKGKALSEKSKELVYNEKHVTKYKGEKHISTVTTYKTPEDKEFAKLLSDYRKSPILPEYRFDDSRFKRFAEVKHIGKKIELKGKGNQKEKEKFKLLNKKQSMVTGQGMHHFIQANIENFVKSDKSVKMKFVIPMWGDYYSMRLRRVSLDSENNLLNIIIEIDNWFLRMFAPDIYVTYNTKTKDLISYKGASNLVDKAGEPQNVVIQYEPCVIEYLKI